MILHRFGLLSVVLLTLSFLPIGQTSYAQGLWRNPSSVIANGYTKKDIGATYGRFESIYGNVKQIIQIRRRFSSIKTALKLYDDTTVFNEKGTILHGHLELDTIDNKFYSCMYFDKYEPIHRRINVTFDTTGSKFIRTYSTVWGDFVGISIYTKNDSSHFDLLKYNYSFATAKLNELIFYKAPSTIGLRETYKYNTKDLLSEVADYLSDNKLEERVLISYLIFDEKGNWLKRIETRKNPKGIVTGMVTTTRKITYY